jgi:hypothetical protein
MKSLGAISFLNRPEFWAFRSNGPALPKQTQPEEEEAGEWRDDDEAAEEEEEQEMNDDGRA